MPAVNPLLAASWTVLGSGGAIAYGTTTAAWLIEAECIFDSISGRLGGSFSSNSNNTMGGSAAFANVLTGINGALEPALVFAVGLTFSAAGLNVGQLADFALDA